MATASLTGLPLELLVHLIATYLPTTDLGALRLTNKYLEKELFDTFAREFFTKKQFMLSTSSLQTLVDISRHGALNKTLKHVIIGLESLNYTSHLSFINTGNMSIAQYEAFRSANADQFALLSSGRDRSLLAEAFRNLPNLDIVGIRDYDAYGRVRDNDRWSSYGAPTLSRQIGFNLRTGSPEFASHVFLMLLQALADADQTVPCIETILRTREAGLTDLAFFLLSPDPKMDIVLGGLRQLLLTLNLSISLQTNLFTNSLYLRAFLLRTPSLNHVRMNFRKADIGPTVFALQCLSSTPNLLPTLQRLEFGMMTISPDFLVQAVSKFSATLNHLSLWKTDLRYQSDARWKDSEDRYNPWPHVLRDLSTTTHLTSITLGCLAHGSESGNSINVSFSDGKISQECSGDMKAWIPRLIDQLVFSWPQRSAMDSDPGSDGEDVDGEDGFTDEDDNDEDEDEDEDYAE